MKGRVALCLLAALFTVFLTNCGDAQSSQGTAVSYPMLSGQGTMGGYPYPMPTDRQVPTLASGPTTLVLPTTNVVNAAPVLGVVVNQDFRVLHVEPGSGAAQAGIQLGDVLVTWENLPFVQGIQRSKDRIRTARPNETYRLSFVRNNEELVVGVQFVPLVYKPSPNGASVPTVTPVLPPNDYF